MENSAAAVVKHPQPPVRLAHPQAGLVGGQGGSRQQTLADHIRLRGEGFARGVEHVDEPALADVEAEQIGQKRRQPREGDALREAQIENKGA